MGASNHTKQGWTEKAKPLGGGGDVPSLDITCLKNSRASINKKYLYMQTAQSYTIYYHIFKLRAECTHTHNTHRYIYT